MENFQTYIFKDVTEGSLVNKAVKISENIVDKAKADLVGDKDIEITDTTKGVIMKSPDGSRWRVTIGDDGVLQTTKITIQKK